jgi:hypothetical protein
MGGGATQMKGSGKKKLTTFLGAKRTKVQTAAAPDSTGRHVFETPRRRPALGHCCRPAVREPCRRFFQIMTSVLTPPLTLSRTKVRNTSVGNQAVGFKLCFVLWRRSCVGLQLCIHAEPLSVAGHLT